MTANATEFDLMTLQEVADELGVSKSSVDEWVYVEQTLPSFKKGKVRRVDRVDLVRFVMVHKLKPRRPEWLTAPLVSEFERQLRELVAGEVRSQLERAAA